MFGGASVALSAGDANGAVPLYAPMRTMQVNSPCVKLHRTTPRHHCICGKPLRFVVGALGVRDVYCVLHWRVKGSRAEGTQKRLQQQQCLLRPVRGA